MLWLGAMAHTSFRRSFSVARLVAAGAATPGQRRRSRQQHRPCTVTPRPRQARAGRSIRISTTRWSSTARWSPSPRRARLASSTACALLWGGGCSILALRDEVELSDEVEACAPSSGRLPSLLRLKVLTYEDLCGGAASCSSSAARLLARGPLLSPS
jgi:hypothetical protein